jgi:pre-mRNA-processing factor 39
MNSEPDEDSGSPKPGFEGDSEPNQDQDAESGEPMASDGDDPSSAEAEEDSSSHAVIATEAQISFNAPTDFKEQIVSAKEEPAEPTEESMEVTPSTDAETSEPNSAEVAHETGIKRKLESENEETPESVEPKKDMNHFKKPHLDEEVQALLPDLQKYWKPVEDDPSDFSGWTHLLQYVDHAVC